MKKLLGLFLLVLFVFFTSDVNYAFAQSSSSFSGIYPGLSVFGDKFNEIPNNVNEVGIGAMALWAGKIWAVTYPPHRWWGAYNYLYEIDPNTLQSTIRPESVGVLTGDVTSGGIVGVTRGGTYSDRMIHTESNQLIIGPYFIDANKNVKVITPQQMPGRLTGIARHLTDPANKVYFYTMEQGLYEVDVHTLAVTTLHQDANVAAGQNSNHIIDSLVPGAHGKSAYTGQGRLIVANNGKAINGSGGSCNYPGDTDGTLAEWNGVGNISDCHNWKIINNTGYSTNNRGHFTDISGPGGIYGSPSNTSPIWAIGWDKRSALLKLLDNGTWYTYRLPKALYTYDEDTGWSTEWPRIMKVDDSLYLLNTQGMFLKFPGTFSASNTGGIVPLSNHLSVVNDLAKVGDQLMMAKNDAPWLVANNPYGVKPQSNFLFVKPEDIVNFGRPSGDGGPWLNDAVTANVFSDPFLINGFTKRVIHFRHNYSGTVTFTIEIDAVGNNNWTTYKTVAVGPNGYSYVVIPSNLSAQWIRFKTDKNISHATAYLSVDSEPTTPDPQKFASLVGVNDSTAQSGGIIRPRDETLQYVENKNKYFEVDQNIQPTVKSNPTELNNIVANYSVTDRGFSVDDASVIVTEGSARWRLPKNSTTNDYDGQWGGVWPRFKRPVFSEGNLINVYGTFYELPFNDSGGMQKIKPIATHNKKIFDFASWRGMLVLSGTRIDSNPNLWFGSVDDIWKMGIPEGVGGPWKNTQVAAGQVSDPYLMNGYLYKKLDISQQSSSSASFDVEVDFAGNGTWSKYATLEVPPAGAIFTHNFPDGFGAHWVRLKANKSTTVSAIFTYSAAPVSCNRCSIIHGCEWTQFYANTNACSPVIGSVIRTTDCSCPQISGGDNSRCTSGCVPIPGDLNGDGHVDILDYDILVADFGNPYNIFDYNFLVANFGK